MDNLVSKENEKVVYTMILGIKYFILEEFQKKETSMPGPGPHIVSQDSEKDLV